MDAQTQIVLSPYSPRWPHLFDSERALLARVFPPSLFRIEHIGSTAVPGLGAKPIVDVMVGGPTLALIEERIAATSSLGYAYVAEHEVSIPQRRFFAKPYAHPRLFHLHAVKLESDFWRDHLLFRDALRDDAALARQYFSLKRELAARYTDDREGYTEAKTPFIESMLVRLRAAALPQVKSRGPCR